MASFFSNKPETDDRYSRLFAPEFEREVEARAAVEALWQLAAPYLDTEVIQAAPREFLARFWEVYLACGFLKADVTLVPHSDRKPRRGGPDLLLASGVFVEATVSTPGSGPDAVVKQEPNTVRDVPREQIILRIRNSIDEKHRKYHGYLKKGYLAATDPYVIAVNPALVPSTRAEPTLPWIVNAVFPFGSDTYHFDRNTLQFVRHSFAPEYDVAKKNAAKVPKDIFVTDGYEGISAVLYCWADEYNHSSTPSKSFIVVHNPLATNKLPLRSLSCGKEFWVEDDFLRRWPASD